MHIQLLLVLVLIFFTSACKPEKGKIEAPVAPPSTVVSPPKQTGVALNDVTRNLIDGLWHIEAVFERNPTPRYQSQKGRYFNFEANGDYALFNPDGSLFHFGKWRYKPGDGDRNYISLDAADTQYNNQYKVLMSKEDAVFVGTERFKNAGVQQRLEKLTSLPASAINAQQQ